MKYADLQGGFIRAVSPYSHGFVKAMQRLKGGRWDPTNKCWVLPVSDYVLDILKAYMFEFSPKLRRYMDEHKEPEWIPDIDLSPVPLPELPNLPIMKKLLPFQREGVQFIDSRNGRALLADEPGLGKSLQALAWLVWRHEIALPAIIVCPATLKLMWEQEMEKWTDFTGYVWSGRYKKDHKPLHTQLHFINYDILDDRDDGVRPDMLKVKPKTLIPDEAHLAAHYTAQRTRCLLKLSKKVDHVIPLTGTPVTGRPISLFYILKMIRPDMFPSRAKFAERYCGRTFNGFSFVDKGATNTEELHEILTKTVMIRRLKKNVLKELPPKRRIVVPIEIDNRKEYNAVLRDFKSWLEARERNAPENLGAYRDEVLRQLIVEGKMKSVIDWIKIYLSNGKKLVVFCTHRRTVRTLMLCFDGIAVKVDGTTSKELRKAAVNEFQNNDTIRLFVGNVDAAGTGLTLTAASATCFIEYDFLPHMHLQAEDRVHRIGQKADSVEAYYLIALRTIEVTKTLEVLGEKQRQTDAVVDGKDLDEDSVFNTMLKKLI